MKDAVIRIEKKFSLSAPRVFDAIRRGELFQCCGKEILFLEFAVGGSYSLKYKNGADIEGKILEIEPNKKFVFTWGQGGRVTIELVGTGNGSMLKLTHKEIADESLQQRFTVGWTDGVDTFQEKLEKRHEEQVGSAEAYDWSKFEINYFYPASLEKVFQAWSTCHGLKSFFIGSIDVTNGAGIKRSDDECFQNGDRYAWRWRHDFSAAGLILDSKQNEQVQFSFGSMTVTVRMKRVADATWLQLTQTNIPTDSRGQVFSHMNCYLCWTFFLTNLKSVLMQGIDLRDSDPARASSFEIGYPLKEVW